MKQQNSRCGAASSGSKKMEGSWTGQLCGKATLGLDVTASREAAWLYNASLTAERTPRLSAGVADNTRQWSPAALGVPHSSLPSGQLPGPARQLLGEHTH